MIGGFSVLAVPASCFFRRLLPYRSPVVGFLGCGHLASGMPITLSMLMLEG